MLNPPDATFVYQIALFLALWVILERFWFAPALRVIRERTRRSEGAVREAATVQAEVGQLRQEHAAALDQARIEAQRDVQELLRAADAEQRRIVEDAQATAQRALDAARVQIAAEVAAARKDLDADVAALARQVATAVLGRSV